MEYGVHPPPLRKPHRSTIRVIELEAANAFLREHYIAEFNRHFQVAAAQRGNAFLACRRRQLDLVFSLQFERAVNRDNTVSFQNLSLQIEAVRWRATLAGCQVTVHQHLDGTLSLTHGLAPSPTSVRGSRPPCASAFARSRRRTGLSSTGIYPLMSRSCHTRSHTRRVTDHASAAPSACASAAARPSSGHPRPSTNSPPSTPDPNDTIPTGVFLRNARYDDPDQTIPQDLIPSTPEVRHR